MVQIMGRRLSEFQKRVLNYAYEYGCVRTADALEIYFEMPPKGLQKLRPTESAGRNWRGRERHDAAVSALTRLCRRGVLRWVIRDLGEFDHKLYPRQSRELIFVPSDRYEYWPREGYRLEPSPGETALPVNERTYRLVLPSGTNQ